MASKVSFRTSPSHSWLSGVGAEVGFGYTWGYQGWTRLGCSIVLVRGVDEWWRVGVVVHVGEVRTRG
jgi:hypothetical protein